MSWTGEVQVPKGSSTDQVKAVVQSIKMKGDGDIGVASAALEAGKAVAISLIEDGHLGVAEDYGWSVLIGGEANKDYKRKEARYATFSDGREPELVEPAGNHNCLSISISRIDDPPKDSFIINKDGDIERTVFGTNSATGEQVHLRVVTPTV
jgi:hypothetical protein